MDPFLRVLLTNAAAAGVVSVAAWLASRMVRRPALVHALWLLAVVRLLAPPLLSLPILPSASPDAAPVRAATATPELRTDTGQAARVLSPLPELARLPEARLVPAQAERPSAAQAERAPARTHPGAMAGSDSTPVAGSAPHVESPSPERDTTRSAPITTAGERRTDLAATRWLGRAALPLIILGAIGIVLLTVWRHVRFAGLLRSAEPASPELLERATTLAALLGLRRAPAIRLLAARVPPMIWLTPRGAELLLPRGLVGELTVDERDALLVHELAHVRRRDHWVRVLEIAATALFWWYPLAWWMRRALRRAEERCCDEWVLRVLPGSARAYATGLLKCASLAWETPTPLSAGASAEPVRELESRLTEVLMTKPSPQVAAPVRLALATLAVAALMVFPTRAASTQDAPEPVKPVPAAPATVTAPVLPAAVAPVTPAPALPAPVAAPAAAETPVTSTPAAQPAPVAAPAPVTSAAPVKAPAPVAAPAPASALAPVTPPAAAVAPAIARPLPSPQTVPSPATAPPAGSAAPPIVRITVERVQVDAVITDKQDRHVTDLRPDEIEVIQSGRRHPVTDLVYVRVGDAARVSGERTAAPAAAARPTVDAAPPATAAVPPRTIVFVVDDLNLSPHGFDLMHSALRHTMGRLDPSDRVALVSTARPVGALEPTTDRRANLDALAAVRRTPWTRTQLAQLVMPSRGDSLSSTGTSGGLFRFDGSVMNDLDARLAMLSIAVVRDAVRALRDIPGRKALVLVSEGIAGTSALNPAHVSMLAGTLERAYGDVHDLNGALTRVAEFAGRAGVVIDAVDPRGLVTGGLNVEDSLPAGPGGLGTHGGGDFGAQVRGRHLALYREQSTLQFLAERTGGLARADTNDVAGALTSIVDDLADYYLIGYAPEAGTFEGTGFRSIKVKVKRPGLKVRTREGFYPVTDEDLWSVVP